jgi:hypothetical protein
MELRFGHDRFLRIEPSTNYATACPKVKLYGVKVTLLFESISFSDLCFSPTSQATSLCPGSFVCFCFVYLAYYLILKTEAVRSSEMSIIISEDSALMVSTFLYTFLFPPRGQKDMNLLLSRLVTKNIVTC